MRKIIVFGAGKSATCLIDYLAGEAAKQNWQIKVADGNFAFALEKTAGYDYAVPVEVDVSHGMARNELIEEADIVISMLPSSLHALVAQNCATAGRNLLTASYVDDDIRKLEPEINKKGLLFLCEMGLDPGIDHMSAMQLIRRIREQAGKITSFYSHCGGLVAPESDDNPWHYKISWNPRNIVLAGKAGAAYKLDKEIIHLPYSGALFDPGRKIQVPGYGDYAWYPNRDSVAYSRLYGLEEANTFIRTTLRHPDFCMGWKKIVELELTEDTNRYNTDELTYKQFLELHLQQNGKEASITEKERKLLDYLGLYDDVNINSGLCSAADIIQLAIQQKLRLLPGDKDLIVMLHEIEFEAKSGTQKMRSFLVVKGENNKRTAMAKTVGLPLGIAAKLILEDKIHIRGLHIPILPEIYEPVLAELQKEGIAFIDEVPISNAG
ncbi:MAG TPA: saccharopine dehydrogenase C-terminal domain-containing protein [Agriterribacter sp.]|nr:saccharopine dehydrogenase C-terminal domain-containing protein [Agriterribacter sp.]